MQEVAGAHRTRICHPANIASRFWPATVTVSGILRENPLHLKSFARAFLSGGPQFSDWPSPPCQALLPDGSQEGVAVKADDPESLNDSLLTSAAGMRVARASPSTLLSLRSGSIQEFLPWE